MEAELLENDCNSIPVGDVEPISMTDLDNLPSEQRRRQRLNSLSSDCSVSIRQGRVYNARPKRKIPDHHKVAMILFIVLLIVVIPWLVYGISRGQDGLFKETLEEEEEYEHEKKIDWSGRDIAGFIVASLLIMVAAGGGIGGGGVLVPTYIFVLGFSPKYAIPLSNCTILGSSISNLILNVRKRHPEADRPLIDWDIMLMMEPLTIAGALVGTYINVLCPPWLITIMLVVLLTLTAHKTLSKGIKKYKQESVLLEAEANRRGDIRMDATATNKNGYKQLGDNTPEKRDPSKERAYNAQSVMQWGPEEVKDWWRKSLPPGCQEYIHIVDDCQLEGADLLDIDYMSLSQFDVKKMLIMKILRKIKQLKQSLGIADESSIDRTMDNVTESGDKDARMLKAEAENNVELIEILKSETYHPAWKVLLMFMTTGGMLTLTILKGGGKINPINITCGTWQFWVITASTIPFVLMISLIARVHLVKMFYKKKNSGYEYLKHDIPWDERATIKYPAICSTAGLCAGMFGIGGGIVKGPLMLEMGEHGVLPQVTSATSATMILFTSSGASVSYLLFQQLNLHYAVVVFCLGIVFTMSGQLTLNALVAKYKRNSLIILVIGVTVAASAIAMGVESSGSLIDLFNGKGGGGGDICAAKGE